MAESLTDEERRKRALAQLDRAEENLSIFERENPNLVDVNGTRPSLPRRPEPPKYSEINHHNAVPQNQLVASMLQDKKPLPSGSSTSKNQATVKPLKDQSVSGSKFEHHSNLSRSSSQRSINGSDGNSHWHQRPNENAQYYNKRGKGNFNQRGRGGGGSGGRGGKGYQPKQDDTSNRWKTRDVEFPEPNPRNHEVSHRNGRRGGSIASLEGDRSDNESVTGENRSPAASGLVSVNADLPANADLAKALAAYRQEDNDAFVARQTQTPQGILRKRIKELNHFRQNLPIYKCKERLIEVVRKHQIVIVIGETGTGKSTQIPQYLVEAGIAGKSKIGVTQPRRIAATSLAERVAEELGGTVGDHVGYAVRFEKKVSKNTVIKYMTDGFFVKECTGRPNFMGYSVIMIDEAHERSIHTDVCLGLLKRAIPTRPDLKVIISSATLECEKLLEFFGSAAVRFDIVGESHEVTVVYRPVPEQWDYLDHVIETVLEIHEQNQKDGDMLVFLPGKEEIDYVQDALRNVDKDQQLLFIVPCHSTLSMDAQKRIHKKAAAGTRKVVLATNIAETSITIDGIVYVVDSGLFKQKRYDPHTNMSTLTEKTITKFHAKQRKGRAGRTCPGTCYRLYTKEQHDSLREAPEPDIKRSNLESIALDLFALGVTNFFEFEFMDKPERTTGFETLSHLMDLSAIQVDSGALVLSPLGQEMAAIPVEPPLAKTLLKSFDLGCAPEVTIIAAMLSAQHRSLFSAADTKGQKAAERKKAQFDGDGDLQSLLNIYNIWIKMPKEQRQKWCRQNFIDVSHLVEAENVRDQLEQIFKSFGRTLNAERGNFFPAELLSTNIRKAFTAGYFHRIAKFEKNQRYTSISAEFAGVRPNCGRDESSSVYLRGSSSLTARKMKPEHVIFLDVYRNKEKRAFMEGVFPIEWEWFMQYGGDFAKRIKNRMETKSRAGSEVKCQDETEVNGQDDVEVKCKVDERELN